MKVVSVLVLLVSLSSASMFFERSLYPKGSNCSATPYVTNWQVAGDCWNNRIYTCEANGLNITSYNGSQCDSEVHNGFSPYGCYDGYSIDCSTRIQPLPNTVVVSKYYVTNCAAGSEFNVDAIQDGTN